jgi:internalin A
MSAAVLTLLTAAVLVPARADPDREAADLVIAAGGHVYLEGLPDPYGEGGKSKDNLPAGPFRIVTINVYGKQNVLQPEHFALFARLEALKSLDVSGSKFPGAGLARLAASKSLLSLVVVGCDLRDADLAPLSGLSTLTDLYVGGNAEITNVGVRSVLRIQKLGALDLRSTKVTDDGLEALARSGLKLWAVNVGGTAVTDRGLQQLAGVRTLSSLSLDGAKGVTSAGLAHLAGLRRLEQLSLTDTPVADAAVTHLRKLPHLRTLNLSHTKMTDFGLDQFAHAGMPLTELNVSIPALTDRGVWNIARMGTLVDVDKSGTKLTDKGLERIVKLPALASLDASNTAVTNASVPILKKLKRLKSLNLVGTKVTDAGFTELHKALVDCHVARPGP